MGEPGSPTKKHSPRVFVKHMYTQLSPGQQTAGANIVGMRIPARGSAHACTMYI